MATVEELIRQYQIDEELKREVDEILADGKVSAMEFMAFARKHDVNVTLADFPRLMKQAREAGLIK